jgi:putative S-layer-like domain protein
MHKKALLTTTILTALAVNVYAADIVLKNSDNVDSNYNLVSSVGNIHVDTTVPKNENTNHNVILGGWSNYKGTNIYNIFSGTEVAPENRNVENIAIGDVVKVKDSDYSLMIGNHISNENTEDSVPRYGRRSTMIKGDYITVKNSPHATVLGHNNNVDTSFGTLAVGQDIKATNATWSVVMGDNATVELDKPGLGSVFLYGKNSYTNKPYTIGMGFGATTKGYGATAIGNRSVANGDFSTALSGGEATGKDSMALGGLSTATGTGAITLGNQNNATANGAIAIGHTTTATKDFSVAIGVRADATGTNSISIGKDTLADVEGSVAIGSNSVTEAATNVEGIYINSEKYKFAGGAPNSVVSFGTNGRDGGGKVISYTRQLQNVAAGRVDDTSTDAVNGSQLNAVINALKFTTVADGENTNVSKTVNIDGGKEFSVNVNKDLYNMNSVNLNDGNNESSYTTKGIDMIYRGDGDTNGLEYKTSYKYNGIAIKINDGDANDIAKITLDENGLNNGGKKITNVARGTDPNDAVNVSQLTEINAANKSYVDSEVRKAGASAAALAALHPLDYNPDHKTDVMAGVGHYKGKTAAALGIAYRPNENVLLTAGATINGRDSMLNAGVSYKLGAKDSTYRSPASMAKDIDDLKAIVEKLMKENEELKASINK